MVQIQGKNWHTSRDDSNSEIRLSKSWVITVYINTESIVVHDYHTIEKLCKHPITTYTYNPAIKEDNSIILINSQNSNSKYYILLVLSRLICPTSMPIKGKLLIINVYFRPALLGHKTNFNKFIFIHLTSKFVISNLELRCMCAWKNTSSESNFT